MALGRAMVLGSRPSPWTSGQMLRQTQLSSNVCLLCIAVMLQLVALS